MSTTTDSDEIRRELSVLAQRVDAIESRLSENGADVFETADLSSRMADVREVTQRLFPGKCEFTSEFDPEYPDDRYVVVNVESSGNSQDIVDRTCEWHAQVRRLTGEPQGKLRLSVVPI
jgi:hypothetical protein